MNVFNMRAFHVELDEQRRSRGLTWEEVAKEINRPFETTPSIPIGPGTLRDMLKKRSVTSAVVLQVLRWLGRTPESFLSGPTRSVSPDEELPETMPDRVLYKFLNLTSLFIGHSQYLEKFPGLINQAAKLVADGKLHVPIAAVYPLTSIKDALRHAQEGGKVLLEISNDK
jgi:hypothetical protein